MARSAKGRPTPVPEHDPEDPVTIPAEELPEEAADNSLCPRCATKLTNPDGLGWCPGCGFCRTLEEEGKALPLPEPERPKKPSVLGATELGEAMRYMPGWVWLLLGGIALVASVSVAADYLLPEDCLARALWGALQMVMGVVGLITAQCWVLAMFGSKEEGIGARDIFLPGRVWRAAFRRLPATRKAVWLGGWSLTGLICGAAVIGGYNYWLQVIQERRVQRLAARLADRAPTARDTSRPFDGTLQPRPKQHLQQQPDGDKRPLTQCVVIGYQTDGKTVTGIVLAMAEADSDTLTFAGVVRDGLPSELRDQLMARLSRLSRKEPLIPGLDVRGTFWVNPGVFCNIIRPNGKGGEGEEPEFKGLSD
jgi:hypothetical protein